MKALPLICVLTIVALSCLEPEGENFVDIPRPDESKVTVNLNDYASGDTILDITTLKTQEYVRFTTGRSISDNTEQYHAASPSSEIGLECQYFFGGKFFVRGSAGLHITSRATLSSDNSEYATVNWTGVKALAGIGVRLVKPGN